VEPDQAVAIPAGSRVEEPARPASEAGLVDILIALSRSDLRARYGRGWPRLLKWLLDPYALVGVYLLLVVFLLDRGGLDPGLSLACAIVPFQIVTSTVINAMGSIDLRRSIVLNMSFKRELLPVSCTLTECIAFGASLSLLALMMVIYAVPVTPAILWFPVDIAATLLVAAAFAYPASLFGLWFVDLKPFAVSFMRILYFIAPGLIPLSEIHGKAGDLVRLNPLSGLFEAYRDALLYGQSPAFWELAIPIGFALLAFSVFIPIYRREQRHFAKLL
jgi:homopolymeric O-antigen transport system permease protein